MDRGVFLTFEGPDGSGKSTNIGFVHDWLTARGYTVVLSREPGGTPIGEEIRSLVLHNKMSTMCELLLFSASRAEHVENKIKPALTEGKIVLCDRFHDSSFAYQGTARGCESEVLELERFVLRGFQPDFTFFFIVDLDVGKSRLAARGTTLDKLDLELDTFKAKVHEGYMRRLADNPKRMIRIDGNLPLEQVQQQLTIELERRFPKRNTTKE